MKPSQDTCCKCVQDALFGGNSGNAWNYAGVFLRFFAKMPFFVFTNNDMAEDDHKVSVADTVKRSDLQEGFAEDLYESCRSRSRNIK